MTFTRLTFLTLGLALAGHALPAIGQDATKNLNAIEQLNTANELVRTGKFGEAVNLYREIDPSFTNQGELNYNLGVAQYRQGDLPAAETSFTQSASSKNTKLAADSRYNLGNCAYAKAIKTAEQDKREAIEQLRDAIAFYQNSLRLNADHADARANIELAVELIEKLNEEQKRQEQEQNQPQQDQQSQSGKSNDDRQQNQEQNQDQQNQDQQNQSNQSGHQNPQQKSDEQPPIDDSDESESQQAESPDSETKQPGSNQSEPNQSESNQSESKGENPTETESPDVSESLPNQKNSTDQSRHPQSERQSAGDRLETPVENPNGEEKKQKDKQIPTGQLTTAGEQHPDETATGTVAIDDASTSDQPMTKEEALKMLQAVRDRDMLRRYREQQTERMRHIPVDRDW